MDGDETYHFEKFQNAEFKTVWYRHYNRWQDQRNTMQRSETDTFICKNVINNERGITKQWRNKAVIQEMVQQLALLDCENNQFNYSLHNIYKSELQADRRVRVNPQII